MGKRLSAVVLVLVAAFAFASVAQAQPSYTVAQRTARQLAIKQVQHRDIVSFHVLKGKRASNGDVLFPYDDRSAQNVFCTATIVVSQTVSGGRRLATAHFRGQHCRGVPTDARGFEDAIRAAQRALRGTALATADSIDKFKSSIRPCTQLRIPRARQDEAISLVDVGETEAIVRPNDAILGQFVAALAGVDTNNAVLRAGAAAWADYLTVLRALPAVSDPCAALQTWAQQGWSAGAAPIDFAALDALDRRSVTDLRAIARTAKLLARDGVFPTAVVGFTPKGLLLGLAPNIAITGGKGSRPRGSAG